jgi:hypothetical protein
MAMALGALQPQAKESVSHLQGAGDARRRATLPVQVERTPLAVDGRVGA